MKSGMFQLLLSLAVVLSSSVVVSAADKNAKNANVDESKAIELFQAVDQGLVEVKLIPKNSLQSSISVTNKTDKEIVVDMPTAFAGVPVLAQPGAMGGRGMGGGMMGGGRGGRGGGGMFAIAPRKTYKQSVRTVCLEHGKKEPRSTVKYTMVPIDNYTNNKTTQVLCEMLGNKDLDQNAVQVAVWSAENGMTMEELAAKTRQTARNNPVESYFKSSELQLGAQLLEEADARAQELTEVEKAQEDLENYAPEETDNTVETITEQILNE